MAACCPGDFLVWFILPCQPYPSLDSTLCILMRKARHVHLCSLYHVRHHLTFLITASHFPFHGLFALYTALIVNTSASFISFIHSSIYVIIFLLPFTMTRYPHSVIFLRLILLVLISFLNNAYINAVIARPPFLRYTRYIIKHRVLKKGPFSGYIRGQIQHNGTSIHPPTSICHRDLCALTQSLLYCLSARTQSS